MAKQQHTMYLTERQGGVANVDVIATDDTITAVAVEDNEPDDVLTPIFQRALEESGIDRYVVEYVVDPADDTHFTIFTTDNAQEA